MYAADIAKKSLFNTLLTLLLIFISAKAWCLDPSTLKTSTLDLIYLSQNKAIDHGSLKKGLLIAQTRKNQLITALQTNPSLVQKYLLPHKIIKTLPANIQTYLEKEKTNITGKLQINVADDFKNSAQIDYVLKTKDGSIYYLYFLDTPSNALRSDEEIKIFHAYSIQLKDKNALILNANEISVLNNTAKAIPTAFGPQKTIVMLVNFQDKPNTQPFTPAHVKNSVFTNLSNKYFEFSFQQTTFVGDVAGWFTVSMNSTDSCSSLLKNLAEKAGSAATASGYDLTKYARQVIIFPLFNDCTWGGYSSIGGKPSVSFINGSDSSSIIAHELGHALGINHSHSLECNGTTNTGTCTRNEYGNLADSMGNPWNYNGPHFNAYQKERLGWLNYQISPPLQLITTSGTYAIDTYETFNQNVKALKVLKSKAANGSNNYYYLEFRQGIGEDASLGTCSSCDYTKGVLITQANDQDGNSSELLDMTPTDNNRGLTTLLPGKSFTDPNTPNGPLTITTNSISSTGAKVTITMGNATCAFKTPTMTISPAGTQYIRAGETATYSLKLTNNDTSPCAASTFELVTTGQMSWLPARLNQASVSLLPGENTSITLTVKPTTTAPVNIYSIGVEANHRTASGINPVTVTASLGVSG